MAQLPILKRRLLGLDISSKCIGWAYFEGERLVKYGKFPIEGAEHGERLLRAHTFLNDLFQANKADEVIVEAPFSGPGKRKTFGILSWYLGVVLLVHYEVFGKELPAGNRLQPRTVKALMEVETSKIHDANKVIMVKRINELFGLVLEFRPKDKSKQVSGDDIADAIAVAWAWLLREKRTSERTERRPNSKSRGHRTRSRKT